MTTPFAPRYDATFLAWNTVAGYDSYEGAQEAVDRLSDRGFPVQHLDIVGSDVRLVERVTGRLTRRTAAAAGAASGVWTGLFIGLLLSLFTTGASVLAVLLTGAFLGAAAGAGFAFAAHSATRGRRDFASTRTLVAARYDVVARNGFAERARRELEPSGFVPA